MLIAHDHATARFVRGAPLLVIAMVLALISLPMPSEDKPVILWNLRIPVGLLVLSSFGICFDPAGWWLFPLPIATLVFVLTPIAFRVQCINPYLIRVGSVALLGVWVFPVGIEYFVASSDRARWGGIQHAAWGYYVYAAALTLALVAVQYGPLPAMGQPRQRRGFPVIPSSKSEERGDAGG